VRIADSDWAPLFTAVIEPNLFTARVEAAKYAETVPTMEEFWDQFTDDAILRTAQSIHDRWLAAGHRRRFGPNHVVLEAKGPATNGIRTVVALYSDGRVLIPFSSYAGQNSGISVDALTTPEFRQAADRLFGLNGAEKQARTAPGWLRPEVADEVTKFCFDVASEYSFAMEV
jgi:hypothetical protein